MFGELGYLALITAMVVALLQTVLPAYGIFRQQLFWQQLAPRFAIVQALCLFLSFIGLALSFLYNDFSLIYVAEHSNTLMPWYYRISAVWGGHEGSMLLWIVILGFWTAAVTYFSKSLSHNMLARVLVILGLIQLAMISFVVFSSSPFSLSLPMLPVDGADLNPILQDPGLIIHPPVLYMGYVGLAVPFAFAMAGLWAGRMDSIWARWSRPWTLVAWSCLTLGIAMGSWWAYYELGWGGWWFWDPVENASLMPWIMATALLHSLATTEKRGVFKAWSVLLAIFAFGLSLLGTFLVRSGVLTSVHAFAADPTRGLYVLCILCFVIGGALTLFMFNAWKLTTESRYTLKSRETLLALNNIILVVATFVVLIGTLYPLLADALNLGRVSVGAPYFNMLFSPLTWMLLVFMALGPLTHWKAHKRPMLAPLLKILLTSILLGAGFTFMVTGKTQLMVALSLGVSLWVLLTLVWDIWQKIRIAPTLTLGIKRLTFSYYGMLLAHVGLVVVVIGVSLTSHLSIERDVALKVGDSVTLDKFTFKLSGLSSIQRDNYKATEAEVNVYKGSDLYTTMRPEKRIYMVQNRPTTEAAVNGGLVYDLYVAMGEPLDANSLLKGAWSMRVYYKPFVRFIWMGALLMTLGGFVAMLDKRYRFARQLATNETLNRSQALTSEIK